MIAANAVAWEDAFGYADEWRDEQHADPSIQEAASEAVGKRLISRRAIR